VSIRPRGSATLGIKTEVKNMNSFRAVQKALTYEIERQKRALGEGERIVQETRLWEAESEVTHPMRSKEEAHDYRYFPEPDLVPVVVDAAWVEEIRASLPESPLKRRDRLVSEFGIPEYDAEVLTSERGLADYFEACVKEGAEPKAASNLIMGEMLRMVKEGDVPLGQCRVRPEGIVEILGLVGEGTISAATGKEVFAEMFRTGRGAAEIVASRGLTQISDEGELGRIAEEVIKKNPKSVEDYRGGKKQAIGFLVGQVMRATGGKANPQVVNRVLREKLG